MYKILDGGIILDKFTGDQIPPDEKNMDYQKYLKWLEEGNTPE